MNQTTFVHIQPPQVVESNSFKLYWDTGITTDKEIQHNRHVLTDISIQHKPQKYQKKVNNTLI